jgi:hypothetical protein
MQMSGVSLALTWPCRLCLLRVLLYASHCYKLSPFQAHWGGDTAPSFSGCHVSLQFTSEVGLPPSPVEFSSLATLTSFPIPGCWARATASPSLARPSLYIYISVRDSSPSLLALRVPTLFAMCLFCSYCLFSVSLFSLGGGRSVQGAMLIWPRVVCGSTTCHLAHLMVHVFPSCLVAQGPSWFLHST